MVRRKFYINGKPSSDFGIYAASDTYLNAPAVGYDSFSVPKVNGLFISEKDRLSNVTRRFSCFAPDGIKAACEALFQYLYSIDGYFVLQSDYDVDHYCYAYFEEGVEVTPFRTYAGSFDLYFSCMPQKYMATGIGKAVSNNLINTDELVGRMAYYDIVNDKLCLMFFPGTNVYAYNARFRGKEGEEYVFTAEKIGTWPADPYHLQVNTTDYPSGGTSGINNGSTSTEFRHTISPSSPRIPFEVDMKVASTDGTLGLTKIMLQKKGATDLPYEPYQSMPPTDTWVYGINSSEVNIKPAFKLNKLQEVISKGLLPNNPVWFEYGGITSAKFYAEQNSVMFAQVNYETVDVVQRQNSFGFVSFFGVTDKYAVSEPFDGSIIINNVTYDAVFSDVSNSDAVGGDALYRITMSVPSNGTQTLSVVVNDAIIFVDMTGLVNSTSYVTVLVNSKTYDAQYILGDTSISVGELRLKPLNDRTTILGDISLKSENKVICYTECTIVSSLVEVDWWTV